MRRSLTLVFVLTLTALGPELSAQPVIEAAGELGYTQVNAQSWLGPGTYKSDNLNWGASAAVLVGRRGPRGIQVGIEAGLTHLITYYGFIGTESASRDINAWRVLGLVRYWPGEARWFLEFHGGISTYWSTTDPTLGLGLGKLFDVGDDLSILTRARVQLISDGLAPIVPVQAQAGLAYRLPR